MTTSSSLTRRGFATGLSLFAVGGGTIAAVSDRTAGSSIDVDWTVYGDTIDTEDGQVDELVFGDPSGAEHNLELAYEGLSNPNQEAEFAISLRGLDDGDETGWTGGAETDWETLATGSYTIPDQQGHLSLSWEDVFGDATPVIVSDHTGISLNDFEPAEPGSRTRGLAVELRVEVPDEGIDASASSTTTVSVNVITSDFQVTITETNSPIVGGETLEVTSSVMNEGNSSAEQMIRLRVDGETKDEQSLELAEDETDEVTLYWDTDESDAGSYEIVVETDDDEDSTTVDVEAPAGELFTFYSGGTMPQGGHRTLEFTLAYAGEESIDISEISVDDTSRGETIANNAGLTFRSTDTSGGYDGEITIGDEAVSLQDEITVEAETNIAFELGEFDANMNRESATITLGFDDGSDYTFTVDG